MKAKIISLIIAVTYIVIFLLFNNINSPLPQDCIAYNSETCSNKEIFFQLIIFLFFSVSLIWFGDSIGGYTNTNLFRLSQHTIHEETPGIFIKIMGWFFLLLPIILIPIILFVEAK